MLPSNPQSIGSDSSPVTEFLRVNTVRKKEIDKNKNLDTLPSRINCSRRGIPIKNSTDNQKDYNWVNHTYRLPTPYQSGKSCKLHAPYNEIKPFHNYSPAMAYHQGELD